MLADILDALICPLCSSALDLREGSLRCSSGHAFDVARQGYVNFLAGSGIPGTADNAEMVQARDAFLSSGHYAPLAALIADRSADYARSGLIVDAGGGTGYYLQSVLERIPGARGVVLDISKLALRRAARSHPRTGAVVWDLWRPLPLRSSTAMLVLNIFAPRNGAEFRRILASNGALIVLTPSASHLRELVAPLGLLTVDANKEERLKESLEPYFKLEKREELEFKLHLFHEQVATLVLMGPSAHHIEAEELRTRIAGLPDPMEATVSVVLSIFRPIA